MTEPADNPVPAVGVPDLLFMVDRTGRILEFQASPRRVLRIPPERMVGHVSADFLPAAAAQALQDGLARTLAEGPQPGILFSVPFPEGERFYEAFIVPPFGPPAPDERLAVIVCDITDRKRAEEALRDSNELLALQIRNSPIYAFIKKVTPAESVVVQASENYRQMIGIPGSEMVGKNMAALFPADLAAKITADDWAIVSEGEVREFEEELNGHTYATIKFPIIQGGQTLLAGYSQDVTERKQAETALRESEARARAVNDNLPGGFVYQVDTGADGRQRQVTFVSQGVGRLHGITADDMMRDNAAAFYGQVLEEDRSRMADLEARAVATMTPFRAEVRFRLPSGEVRWGLLTSAPRRLPNGHLLWDGVEVDITDRKEAEAALRESEAKYRLLFESAGDAIYIHDEQGRILDANPIGTEQLGYTLAELKAMTAHEVDAPAEVHHLPERIAQLARQGHLEFETLHRRKDGGLFPVEVKARLITWNGQPAALSICRDVTARKRAEEALQASEAKYRLLFESAGDAIYILDTNGWILAVNPTACQQTGYAAAELTAMDIAQVNAPEFSPRVPERMQRLIQDGHLEHETMLRRKDGTLFPVEVKTKLHTWNGQPAAMSLVRDVSARKQADAALRASEAKNRLLFESIRDPFVRVDMEGHILEHNLAYEELTGYSAEELRHLTYLDLTPKKWHALEAKMIAEQVFPQGVSEVYEKEYRRKDGTLVPIELRTTLLRDAAGRPAFMWATIRDISERKRANRFLRLVLDNIPGGVFWKDRKSVFLGCNQTIATATGLSSPDQIVGKTDYDLGWKKEESDHYVAVDRRVMENDRAEYHIVEPQRQAGGQETWLDTCKIPLHDEQGRVIGILGTFTDITERLRMERELKSHATDLERRVQARTAELEASRAALEKNEALFRQMAEGIQEVFWLFEAQTQKALFISPSFERVWGRSRAEVSRDMASWLACILPEDQARVRRRFEQVMASGLFEPIQYRIVHPDGTLRWLEDRAWAIRDEQGRVYRVAGVSRDITEHRRLESEVLNAGETERQRIGRDLHDGLSQALTAIGYLAEAVHDSLASASRPETADVRKMVEWIAKTGKQAHAMAQGLLLTDLKRGGLLPALQELALTTEEYFGVACRYRGPEAVALPSVEVAQQLYRIAQEAATNAAKHSKGKTIDIRLAKTRAGLLLSIRDDGQGLPVVAGARAGLGLEIMQYRAGLIGATLSVKSVPGRGARVACLIPRAAAPPRKTMP